MKKIFKFTFTFLFFIISCFTSLIVLADEENGSDISYDNFYFDYNYSDFLDNLDSCDLICNYDYWNFKISGYRTFSNSDIDIPGYTFTNNVLMHYCLEYDKPSNTFCFIASTIDDNDDVYLETLIGVAYYNSFLEADILFTDGEDFITLKEIEQMYSITLGRIIVADDVIYTYCALMVFCIALYAIASIQLYYSNPNSSSNVISDVCDAIDNIIDTVDTVIASVSQMFYTVFDITKIYDDEDNAMDRLIEISPDLEIKKICEENKYKQPTLIDDVLDLDWLKKKKEELGVTNNDIISVIIDMVNVDIFSRSDYTNPQILCIGREFYDAKKNYENLSGTDFLTYEYGYYNIWNYLKTQINQGSDCLYQNYANHYGYLAFYTSDYAGKKAELDNRFNRAIGADLLFVANEALIIYGLNNEWVFAIVTKPQYYIQGCYEKDVHYGGGYCMELKTLRDSGYNNFNVNYVTWLTLMNETMTNEVDLYTFAGYMLSRL